MRSAAVYLLLPLALASAAGLFLHHVFTSLAMGMGR